MSLRTFVDAKRLWAKPREKWRAEAAVVLNMVGNWEECGVGMRGKSKGWNAPH